MEIKKGYTLTVVSWENDGDYYNTKHKTVATIEEAKVWYEMMQLCKSKNNQPNGIVKLGNSCEEFNGKQIKVIKEFMEEYGKILLPEDNFEEGDDDTLIDWFTDLAGELIGYSEYYICRVMESCTVTYSPIDIKLEDITSEIINFKFSNNEQTS